MTARCFLVLVCGAALLHGCGDDDGTGGSGDRLCETSAECDSDEPICDPVAGVCVECVRDGDCSTGGDVCRVRECGAAVSCTSGRDCRGLVCDTDTELCVECLGDADCPGEQTCIDTFCEGAIPPCESDRQCNIFGLVCDVEGSECVECVTRAHCGAGELCIASRCTESADPPDGGTLDAGVGDDAGPVPDDAGEPVDGGADEDAGSDAGDGPPDTVATGGIGSCASGAFCLEREPDVTMIFSRVDETYYFWQPGFGQIWHGPSDTLLLGSHSSNGYWQIDARGSGWPGRPDHDVFTPYGRLVHMPATDTFVRTSAMFVAPPPEATFVGTIDPESGELLEATAADFEDGFTGVCQRWSSSPTEFLCFDGENVRRYLTHRGSNRLTLVRLVSLRPTLPLEALCETACSGGRFAWDGAYYYFAEADARNVSYHVYDADGLFVAEHTAAEPGHFQDVYFDWSAGRYFTLDMRGGTRETLDADWRDGGRWGGRRYTSEGTGFPDYSDNQCWGPVSGYHALTP